MLPKDLVQYVCSFLWEEDIVQFKMLNKHYYKCITFDCVKYLKINEKNSHLLHFKLKQVKELYVSNVSIDMLENLENVEKLICVNSSLKQLPSFLPKLRYLDCSKNQLTELPFYQNLIHLNCSKNKISVIPEYKMLRKLYCSENLLKTIPNLKHLKILVCSYNQITTLPNLASIKVLDCSDNLLTVLPNSVLQRQLDFLDCSFNDIINQDVSRVNSNLLYINNQLTDVLYFTVMAYQRQLLI